MNSIETCFSILLKGYFSPLVLCWKHTNNLNSHETPWWGTKSILFFDNSNFLDNRRVRCSFLETLTQYLTVIYILMSLNSHVRLAALIFFVQKQILFSVEGVINFQCWTIQIMKYYLYNFQNSYRFFHVNISKLPR